MLCGASQKLYGNAFVIGTGFFEIQEEIRTINLQFFTLLMAVEQQRELTLAWGYGSFLEQHNP